MPVLLEILRPLSFMLSMLSLFPVLTCAFFVPGTLWKERLEMAFVRVIFSAAACLLSGMLYARWPDFQDSRQALLITLPMRIFWCALAGMAVLFVLSWYLNEYYVPLASRTCCRL
jgi:hypothetical protein